MFECMEIAEAIYKGGAHSKNTQWAESYHASSGRKKMGGAPSSPSNPKQGRTGKHKRINSGHMSDEPTISKNKYLMHGP